jgi:hypothetical protein
VEQGKGKGHRTWQWKTSKSCAGDFFHLNILFYEKSELEKGSLRQDQDQGEFFSASALVTLVLVVLEAKDAKSIVI